MRARLIKSGVVILEAESRTEALQLANIVGHFSIGGGTISLRADLGSWTSWWHVVRWIFRGFTEEIISLRAEGPRDWRAPEWKPVNQKSKFDNPL